MRIATWNLNRSIRIKRNRKTYQKQMAEINADIWVLTETDEYMIPGQDYVCAAMSPKGMRDPDAKPEEVWTAIWVHNRFSWQPVKRHQEDEIEKGCTACALVDVDGNKPLLVYGTVLPWIGDTRRTDIGGAAAFIKSLEAQSSEWTWLRKEHPDAHLCVAGDFNQSYEYERYYGTKLGQKRLREELGAHDLVCPTGIKDPLREMAKRPNIDHICISNSYLENRPYQVCAWFSRSESGSPLSDHHGILLVF